MDRQEKRLPSTDPIVNHMARIEIEDFSDKNISRVFVAASIREAEFVEDILTQDGGYYAVSLEPFVQGIFVSERDGIAFYVLSAQALYCKKLLESKGLYSGLTVDEPL